LGVDVLRACLDVRAAVPAWDGRATVLVEDGPADVAAETVGRTVRVHREAWPGLSPRGRQEVLTHELVHVATAALTTPRTPAWLAEGLAEAVAVPASGIPDRTVGQELATAPLPTRLPTDADFGATPAVAYEESWLAVSVLQARYGEQRLLAAYRLAGGGSSAVALGALGTTPTALTGALRSEIRRRLW
jgi:hypothetical protein